MNAVSEDILGVLKMLSPPKSPEILAVIEEHRIAVGADHVNLTLGDQATPEGLREELAKMRAQTELFDSFDQSERDAAHIARLRDLCRTVDNLARTGNTAEIIRKLDIIPQGVYSVDIPWMVRQREKRGIPLPAGAKEFLEELDRKKVSSTEVPS